MKADWSHKSMRATVYANFLAGMGRFVLAPPGFGEYNQHDQTYEAFFTDSRLVGNRHLLSYGVSARYAVYDMINATNRGSGGVYLQDDIRLSEKFRGVIGARVDYVERMGSTVSPRVSLLFSPGSGNTFRASYNRAFQAPTAIQNFFLNQGVRDIPISYADSTYLVSFPVLTTGNPDLEEVKLDNFEIGWVGQFVERVEASASVYWNQRRNAIVGNQAVEVYTSSNPPPGWPADLPDSLLDGQYSGIPSVVTNDNVAQIDNLGVELAMSVRLGQPWTVFANYSWQDDSITEGIESVLLPNGQTVERINQPPAHRGNAGVFWDIHRFFANANVTAQSEAFWTDVRGPLYWGSTDSFAALNLGVGARVFEQQATVSVNVQNIFDDTVLQHVSSDIISRKVTAEITYRF